VLAGNAMAALSSPCQGRLRVSEVDAGEAPASQRGRPKLSPKSAKLNAASPSWPPPSAKAPPRHAADTAKLDRAIIASLVRIILFSLRELGQICWRRPDTEPSG